MAVGPPTLSCGGGGGRGGSSSRPGRRVRRETESIRWQESLPHPADAQTLKHRGLPTGGGAGRGREMSQSVSKSASRPLSPGTPAASSAGAVMANGTLSAGFWGFGGGNEENHQARERGVKSRKGPPPQRLEAGSGRTTRPAEPRSGPGAARGWL